MTDLPALTAWIDGLPQGLASYPSCQVKGTMVRAVLRDGLHERFAARLPRELRQWVEAPPLATQWVPEVEQLGLVLAAFDGHFVGAEPPFLAWSQRSSQQALTSPVYKVMFAVAGPGLLLQGMSRRWSALRRGTSLELVAQGTGWAEVDMRFEPRLYDDLLLRVRGRTFLSAVETAGGKDVSVRIASARETSARYRVEWR